MTRGPSAAERVTDVLRELLLRGELAPGDRLKEEELAALAGASRTPVREALHRLEAEGLVRRTPGGAVVSDWGDEDLDELMEVRAVLEGFGARLAAARIAPAGLERLAALADEMEQLADGTDRDRLDQIAKRNNEFHRVLLEASGSARVQSLLAQVVQVPLVHRTFHRYGAAALRRSLAHHHELVAALRAGDGTWAELVMRTHVAAARAELRA